MNDNKVSEKAIWEGSITPDNNDTPSWGSQMQSQPQMMFCYKCNNVIPGDSKYCPCCNIELYTTCPKCGVKYSSQYSICSQCGTNRVEFLEVQRREQERVERLKRVERIRQENLERERQEVERKQKEAEAERKRQARLKRYEQQETKRKQKEAYLKENDEIMKTKEYETTYSLISEALETYKKKARLSIFFIFCSALLIIGTIYCIYWLIWGMGSAKGLEKFLLKYVSKKNGYDNDMVTYVIKDMKSIWSSIYNTFYPVQVLLGYLPDSCVNAYRTKYGLPIKCY